MKHLNLLFFCVLLLSSLSLSAQSNWIEGETGPEIIEYEIEDLREEKGSNSEEKSMGTNYESISLESNLAMWPNPFTESITIEFTPQQSNSKFIYLKIYSSLGQLVRLIKLDASAGGTVQILWDGNLENGGKAPPGIYYFTIPVQNQKIQGIINRL